MKKLVLQKMCFCDALKLRREIKEERQIPALPTICKNISVKTKLCTKLNFYFIIWKAYLFPTTGNRFSTESQTRMGRKKLAQLLSFPIQICTKISTKILENIHSNWVSVKGIRNSMKLLALRVRLSPSLCQININWSLFADSAGDTHSLQQTPINLSHGTYRCFGHQTKTISSLVSNCANILGDSYKKVLPMTSMVFYGTQIENLFLTVS